MSASRMVIAARPASSRSASAVSPMKSAERMRSGRSVADGDRGLERVDAAAERAVRIDEDRLRPREPRGHERLLFDLDFVSERSQLGAHRLGDAGVDEHALAFIV